MLGVDLGDTRTGLAISDELRLLAHPLETISNKSNAVVARHVMEIVSDRNIERVVVGLPRHMNGSLGAGAEKAMQFAEKLRRLVACEVVMWDERLSTQQAARALHASGKTTRQSRHVIDQVAAQMILQSYLDRLNG